MTRTFAAGFLLFFCSLLVGAPAFGQTIIEPEATGTVEFFPEFGIGPRRAPIGDDVQSTYSRTTSENRRFRRGFAEFELPLVPDLFRATLRLNDCRGTGTFPLPPDTHELSYYLAVDTQVDAADYDRSTILFATFDTDVNLETASFSFDVTDLVRQHQDGPLGFRFKLAADPTLAIFGFAGSAFCNIRIEAVTLTEAPLQLIADIAQLGLPSGLTASLTAKLDAAHAALSSGNVAAACGDLQAFVNQVNAQSGPQPGKTIPADIAAQLIGAATAIREALNCP